ncbi:MAG: hypothetical protein LBU60_05205 [Clostridiales bacterium]|jgi:hypothetical protein|nr:hypothetical protein [Clostridiales bacterium]
MTKKSDKKKNRIILAINKFFDAVLFCLDIVNLIKLLLDYLGIVTIIRNPDFDELGIIFYVRKKALEITALPDIVQVEKKCEFGNKISKKDFYKDYRELRKNSKRLQRRLMKQDKSRCLKVEQSSEQQEPDNKEVIAVLEPNTNLPSVLSPLQLQQLAKDLLPLLIQSQTQFMSKEQNSS